MYAVVAHSEEIEGQYVADELIACCDEKLAGRAPKAGIMLAAIDSEFDVLVNQIMDKWPALELIGASTDGELSSERGFADDSVTLMLFGGDDVDIVAGVGLNTSENIEAACTQAISEASAKTSKPMRFAVTIPESLSVAGKHVIVGTLVEKLGKDVPLFGGTSADQWRFKETRQFCGRQVLHDSVPLLIFAGDIQVSHGVATGWESMGEPGTVTRAEGATVYEIDDLTALQFYQKYMGADFRPSGQYPLAILDQDGEIDYLRATAGIFDESTGSVTFFANVHQGASVQVSMADRNAILEGCSASVDAALSNYPEGHKPEAAIVFSCSARKLLLGTRVNEESQLLREKLGDGVEFFGFYGYGEIGPNTGADNARFHNETFVTLLMGS